MTDAASPSNAQNAAQPALRVLGQYVKDLSFENPHAPQSLANGGGSPDVAVGVNVNARPLADNDYEAELRLEVRATQGERTVFIAELNYAGVFRLENIPADILQPMLLVECPRLLFPFARQVLADATRNGGFPPVMLDPIDFGQLYQRRLQAAAAKQGAGSA